MDIGSQLDFLLPGQVHRTDFDPLLRWLLASLDQPLFPLLGLQLLVVIVGELAPVLGRGAACLRVASAATSTALALEK